ncbi:MAG: glycosyltransferase family 4 protein [Rhodobacteraceae bacterium]|nr:glycosyltransferase family 4 protein [Paracoccaceae bacterium]
MDKTTMTTAGTATQQSAPQCDPVKIVLIAPNAGTHMGGEAIKAYQYFRWLLEHGIDAVLVTHERNRQELEPRLPAERVLWIKETALQALLWRSRVLSPLISVYFHCAAARLVRGFDAATTLVHYICPISPVTLRFPPRNYRVVMGPLNGNLGYPPAFRHRAGRKQRLEEALYGITQRVWGAVFGDKRRAETVLVSGGERTRAALRLAGVKEERMIDVLDAGVSMALAGLDPAAHQGRNPHFVAMGRFDAYKAYDLTIRAVAAADTDISVTIFGDGYMRAPLQELAHALGVADRVSFPGWLAHDDLPDLRRYRGFVFPTLAEANGIVMQEAMMLGLPVVTLRWGGPAMLADDDSAVFIEPDDEDAVVARLADAMNRLAGDPALATRIGVAARARARGAFSWEHVAASWAAHYAAGGTRRGQKARQ